VEDIEGGREGITEDIEEGRVSRRILREEGRGVHLQPTFHVSSSNTFISNHQAQSHALSWGS